MSGNTYLESSNNCTKTGQNCNGDSTSLSGWVDEKSFHAECSDQGENSAERKHEENERKARAEQQLLCVFYIHMKVAFFSFSCCLLAVF